MCYFMKHLRAHVCYNFPIKKSLKLSRRAWYKADTCVVVFDPSLGVVWKGVRE